MCLSWSWYIIGTDGGANTEAVGRHITRCVYDNSPDSKLHGANMGPIWGRQDHDGAHVDPMNLAIWVPPKNLQRNGCICSAISNGVSLMRIDYVYKIPLALHVVPQD